MSKRRLSASPAKSSNPSAAVPAAPSTAEVRTAWQVHGLRIWLVVMIGATLQLTWPLWSERSTPPWLPLAPWPAFAHFGTMLAATAAATIFWPRAGFAAHVLVGLAAMTADQTRMQPQMFSFWLLMLGTLPFPVPQFLARCHLASLWFFSGFHKLLSPPVTSTTSHRSCGKAFFRRQVGRTCPTTPRRSRRRWPASRSR